MDQKYALSFTAEANRIKIPSELDWLQILGVREKNYDIRYLLKTLDSSSIRTFIFGGSLDEPLSGEELVGFYLPVLEYMLSIGEVILTNWYFTSSSFESLLKIGFKIYELTLENCRFDFKRELWFEWLGYKLAIITLRHCFYDNLHSQSITFIKTICNGIVECSYLKHTLRSFQIEYPSNDDFQSWKYKPITLDDYTGLLQIDRFEWNVNDWTRQLFYNYSRYGIWN